MTNLTIDDVLEIARLWVQIADMYLASGNEVDGMRSLRMARTELELLTPETCIRQ